MGESDAQRPIHAKGARMILGKSKEKSLQHGVGQALDDASETAQRIGGRIENGFREAKEGLTEVRTAISGQANAAVEATDQYAHAHPWKSIGIAAAAGVVIGILLGVRSRSTRL